MAIDGKTLGLALSGGGYRATLFGLGSLWRLNDAGLLGRLDRITSVSGGSILAGILAHGWPRLQFTDGRASNFTEVVVEPTRCFCGQTIDIGAGLAGMLMPFKTAGEFLADRYAKDLFGDTTLKQLPAAGPGVPKFTFYATNLQTGRSFRFRQDMVADYMLGVSTTIDVPLAFAVAASSAFPPLFSPIILKTDPSAWREGDAPTSQIDALRRRIVLADGGVYDNMGLESLVDNVDIVLVSDAGAPFGIDEKPWEDNVLQLGRVRDILIDQTRALRKRWLMSEFVAGRKRGAYWGIGTRIAAFGAPGMTPDTPLSDALEHVPTRLRAFDAQLQGHLINWGYALCDIALRARAGLSVAPASSWPVPEWPLFARPPDFTIDGQSPQSAPPELPKRAGAKPPRAETKRSPPASGPALESLPRRTSQAARPTVPRYVHASSRWIDNPTAPCRAYVVGRPVRVEIDIDARRLDSTAAPTPFPEERLPPAAQHELQVLLHEPRQFDQPMLASITLPRTGRSTAAVFDFTPRAEGAFEARLSILHRGRVLQTLLLRTQVLAPDTEGLPGGPGITLDEETRVRDDWSDLDRRRQFDLAMVFNHTPAGEPLATAVAGARAWATSLDAVDAPVHRINGLISAVAQSVADHDGGLDQGENPALLTNLARSGADLYSLLYRDQLQPLASDGLDIGDPSITHIQLISTREDAVVPLEFMYDFNVPNPGAPLCPQHREALERGCCPDGCARAAQPRGYVCPMGFWGLKKVIERHMYDPRAQASLPAGAALAVQVEAVAGRDRLDLSAGALVAHSRQVKSAQVRPLLARLKKKYRRAPPVARDWNDWSQHIQTSRPALLITFPHNEGLRPDQLLEISGDRLFTTGLEPEYVHAAGGPAPVVFLLGCDVAGAAQDFSGHIRYFRQAGAAVVISTIATVFGAHAVRVGEAIVAGLLAADAGESVSIGERIRDAKRAALLDSIPMALCVVAFGDADWRL